MIHDTEQTGNRTKMKGYIYKYTFPDGKVYIGQTRRDPQIRHREHISSVTGPTNSGFWKAYSTFKKCKFEIIQQFECNNIEQLVNMLNYAETQLIINYKANDPKYGYNKQMWGHSHTNYNTKETKIIRAKINELYKDFLKERMDIYNSVSDKILNTHLPLSEDEKKFIRKRCFNNEFLSFPKSFNINNLENNSYTEDTYFEIEETLDFVKVKIEEETNVEFQGFLKENCQDIAEQSLNEHAEANTVIAIDKDGNVAHEFHSFDEIASYFNIKRAADNVKNVLAGRQKSAYGYNWRYKKDKTS